MVTTVEGPTDEFTNGFGATVEGPTALGLGFDMLCYRKPRDLTANVGAYTSVSAGATFDPEDTAGLNSDPEGVTTGLNSSTNVGSIGLNSGPEETLARFAS